MKCEKAIYGTNDASRQWYLALKETLEGLGWEDVTFENATFQLLDAEGNRIALMCFHVDDFLMGWDLPYMGSGGTPKLGSHGKVYSYY